MNRILGAALVGGLLLFSGAQAHAPATAHAEIIDRIVARVNDGIVTSSDVARTIPIYIQVVGVDPNTLRSTEGRAAIARDVMNRLIEDRLVVADARERDLLVTDREVDAFLEQQRSRMGVSEAQLREELERQGLLYADFREFMRAHITRQRMIQVDVGARVEISEDDVEAALRELYPDGIEEIAITTSHILVPVAAGSGELADQNARERIAALYAELQGGRPFEEIAREVNPDASRNTGGRIGRFGIDELDPDYSRAALALDPGETSEPVRTQFGWHIVRLENLERRPATNADAIRDRVHFDLYQREASRQQRVYFERLRSDAYVEIVHDDFLM